MSEQGSQGKSVSEGAGPEGRYIKLAEVLGKGAYKIVHKAIDVQEGYEVAWNTCQVTGTGNKGKDYADLQEFTEEIKILKRVRHPNIIQFYDFWFSNSEFVFITELMTSGTLREYIKKLKVLNEKIVRRWARQIMRGIYFLHSYSPPVIHRDIKCDNIFINGCYGEVKIGDMGTSKMKLGKKYTVIGTPEFMAPEMYDEKGYNESVDIYAFGMALLEMITGEYPYSECKNAAQIYKKVSQGVRPDCLKKVTSPDVLDLIVKTTDLESKRPTAAQVLEHRLLASEPEVFLISVEGKSHLGMRVVLNRPDKFSVNFQFDINTDTAEQVVNEMIAEDVLPAEYKDFISSEINNLLRNLLREKDFRINTDFYLKYKNWNTGNQNNAQPETDNERQYISESAPEIKGRDKYPGKDIPESSKRVYFKNEAPVEDIVIWAAKLSNKREKISEWLSVLSSQDISTVGDLRQLHDEDWSSLPLTVFARRSLRNCLACKNVTFNNTQEHEVADSP